MLHSLKEAPKHLVEYSTPKIFQLWNRLSELTTTGVGEDINTVGKHIIEQKRDSLKNIVLIDHLKRDLEAGLGVIAVDFTEYFLPFIDTGIKMLHSLKVASKDLAEYSTAKLLQLCNRLSELTTTGVGEDINTVKPILQERRIGSPDVTRDPQILRRNIINNSNNILDNLDINDVREIFIEREVFSSSMFDEIEKTYSGSENHMSAVLSEIIISGPRAMRTLVDVLYINQLDSLADGFLRGTPNEMKVIKGHTQTELSTMTLVRSFQDQGITCFDGLYVNLVDQLLVILREQGMAYVLDRLNNCRNAYSVGQHSAAAADSSAVQDKMDDSDLKELSELEVKLRCLNNNKRNMTIGNTTSLKIERTQSEQQTTVSLQHTMNVTIIAVNRSFLIEEISTMTLVRAFQDQGITCFDGLDGILGRQERAEHFLTILEENNLLDQLLVILREQGMTYVLDRFNNCRNAYSADPQILERNIFNNRTDILDNLDIDDVREIFIERDAFNSSMFDEIEEKYSGSEDQMSAVLIAIIKSGPRAMRILVDALYINQLESLADSLLMETPNELQEIQDNTQIDESSSDGELLYEATYKVSKAVEKSPFHQMPEDNTVSVPSK